MAIAHAAMKPMMPASGSQRRHPARRPGMGGSVAGSGSRYAASNGTGVPDAGCTAVAAEASGSAAAKDGPEEPAEGGARDGPEGPAEDGAKDGPEKPAEGPGDGAGEAKDGPEEGAAEAGVPGGGVGAGGDCPGASSAMPPA